MMSSPSRNCKAWYDSVMRKDLEWPEDKLLPMTCEVKIDGLALNLIYRNGVLDAGTHPW
jgi:DNA ligase (NAD+)